MKIRFVFLILAVSISSLAKSQSPGSLNDWLQQNHCKLSVRLNQYDYSHYNRLVSGWTNTPGSNKIEAGKAIFDFGFTINQTGDDYMDVTANFDCVDGSIDQASLSVDLNFEKWSSDNFVLMPGVVYNGNKFKVWKSPDWYPFITDTRYVGKDLEPFVTDIPRLSRDGGVSRIQMRSGHMTTPSIGFQSQSEQRGFWLVTEQGSQLGDHGIDIEENRNRTEAKISLTAPVVREVYRYHHLNTQHPSSDPSASFKKGDNLKIHFRIYFFNAPAIQDIYNKYADIRKVMPADRELVASYPFSNTFDILERKFNRDNWDNEMEFYIFRPDFFYKWQIGWMGGAIYTYSLLMDGGKESHDRVVKTFDWLFSNGISPSGYFWDSSIDGKEFHGIYREIPVGNQQALVRCNGDGLYYSIKHFVAMKKLGIPVKPLWEEKTKGVANAFLKTWNDDKQLGQYVNQTTGKVEVGQSTSGAIVPAALVLVSNYYNDKLYLQKAEEIAEYYYQNFTVKGFTIGGPGDALQNPDCESSFGLVESFTMLYEATGKEIWLKRAEEAANQFSTWVLSYNFKFPASSTYGKYGMKPMGAVFANPQNGTGTPAICTYSGLSLLNLSRYTGNPLYAEMLRDIAHNIPQYLSHPDRMINPEHEGWMSERVVTADWLEEIGEIVLHSTWCEVALALTYSEIPGIYINTEEKSLLVFDNIEASIEKISNTSVSLNVKNPTKQAAKIKVAIDENPKIALPVNGFKNFQLIELKPGESRKVVLKRNFTK